MTGFLDKNSISFVLKTHSGAGKYRAKALIQLILFLFSSVLLSSSLVQAGGLEDLVKGDKALRAGQYKQANRILSSVIRSGKLADEKLAQAFLRRGTASYMMSHFTAAISDFTTAIELKVLGSKAKSYAFYYRGKSFEATGLKLQAKEDLSTASRFGYTGRKAQRRKTGAVSSQSSNSGRRGSGQDMAASPKYTKPKGNFLTGWFGSLGGAGGGVGRQAKAEASPRKTSGETGWERQNVFDD